MASSEFGTYFETETAIYIQSVTYMNRSAGNLKELESRYEIPDLRGKLMVVVDELDKKVGTVRLKPNGSSNGHNGVKSIMSYFGGEDNFQRMLIGIDRPESRNPIMVSQWVLGNFTEHDLQRLKEEVFPKAKKVLEDWLN